MERSTRLFFSVGILLMVFFSGLPAWADGLARYAGHVHSMVPADGKLVIEEVGANGMTALVEVQIRGATAVRVGRDPDHPWLWWERPVRLYRLPARTFVIIIGHEDGSGVINANRIEVPEIKFEE